MSYERTATVEMPFHMGQLISVYNDMWKQNNFHFYFIISPLLSEWMSIFLYKIQVDLL